MKKLVVEHPTAHYRGTCATICGDRSYIRADRPQKITAQKFSRLLVEAPHLAEHAANRKRCRMNAAKNSFSSFREQMNAEHQNTCDER